MGPIKRPHRFRCGHKRTPENSQANTAGGMRCRLCFLRYNRRRRRKIVARKWKGEEKSSPYEWPSCLLAETWKGVGA